MKKETIAKIKVGEQIIYSKFIIALAREAEAALYGITNELKDCC